MSEFILQKDMIHLRKQYNAMAIHFFCSFVAHLCWDKTFSGDIQENLNLMNHLSSFSQIIVYNFWFIFAFPFVVINEKCVIYIYISTLSLI